MITSKFICADTHPSRLFNLELGTSDNCWHVLKTLSKQDNLAGKNGGFCVSLAHLSLRLVG